MENLLEATVEIVAAYVSHNSVMQDDLPAVIKEVHEALVALVNQPAAPPAKPVLQPAVPVDQSIQPDHLVCLEDGKKFKALKRHLRSEYQLTPDQYRARWGLPSDYPMVAPSYAAKRSELAKTLGLGRRG